MVATEDQIKQIVLNNPNADYIAKNLKYNKEMRTHLYGENVEGKILKIEGMEDKALRDLRAKYVRTNKDLFSRLGRNMDKVFSARGGSTYYNLSDQMDRRAIGICNDIRDGYSIKKWIESYWLQHAKDDPMGLIFIEIGDGYSYPVGQAYPTYKATSDIYDYPPPKGATLDYVVFSLSEDYKKKVLGERNGKLYRFVDDANDYLVIKEEQKVDIIKSETIPNYFHQVPAMINSDVVSGQDENIRLSLFDEVIELANHFILKGSIKITHEFMHGFPKYWEYADDCHKCRGIGQFEGKDCPVCAGSGRNPMVKVSDVKLLVPPESKDTPVIAPNVGGYIEPSKTYYEIATTEMSVLEEVMNFTMWGTTDKKKVQGPDGSGQDGVKTATEILDDHQPMVARLNTISESAEKRHKFIADLCLQINLRQPAYPQSGGASINYGRRYLILNEDEIWAKYMDARTKKAPQTTQNDLLRDFIETKYSGDPVSRMVNTKLITLEPFIYMTVDDSRRLVESDIDYLRKLYFWEWVKMLPLAVILKTDIEQLDQQLTEYATTKLDKVNEVRKEKAALATKPKPSLN